MSSEIDKKRNDLVKAYPGYSWHEKVASMSEDQVIAVYLRFERDGWPNVDKKEPEPKPEPKRDDDDGQLPLF